MKLLIFILTLSLATTLICSAPAEDSSSTTSSPAVATDQSEATTTIVSQSEATTAATATTSHGEDTTAGGNTVYSHTPLLNSSFTCFNRSIGYYADTEAQCKVYHFCMLGNYNGQEVYQRVSYMCLNETVFDQQALDCIDVSKMSAPCEESAKYYDESNVILRKAVIGKPNMEELKENENKPDEKKGDEQKET